MPSVMVYIREENLDKWKSIGNKSEWINAVLKNADDTSEWGETKDTPVGPAVTVLTETMPAEQGGVEIKKLDEWKPTKPDPETGYLCCVDRRPNPETGIKPCKHWVKDDDGDWTNTLTGEVLSF